MMKLHWLILKLPVDFWESGILFIYAVTFPSQFFFIQME